MKKMRLFEGLNKKDVSGLIRNFSASNPDVKINKIFFVNVLRDARLVRACVFYEG